MAQPDRINQRPMLDLMAPGAVEALVAEGREPVIAGARVSGPTGYQEHLVAVIPPVGVQKGDSAVRHLGFIYEIFSPEGVSRGRTEALSLDPMQANIVRDRIKQALANPPKP